MAMRLSLIGVALVVATALLTSHAISQEGGAKKPSPEEMKKMMEEWLALGKPAEPHAFLAKSAGKWNTVTKMWMDPSAPATETKGTAEFRMVMGGRYQIQETTGSFMGKPMLGMGMTGYDNFRNRFDGVWVDNLGTAMLRFSGRLDRTGKVLTMYGEMDEPGMKLVGRMVKYVKRVIDEKKFVFEIYDLAAGPNHRVMEITYTRPE